MPIRGVTEAVHERTPLTGEARTRRSEAHEAIEHTGEEFAGERGSLSGRVTMGDRAAHLVRKIQGARNISILKKGIATRTVKHIVPKLSWAERPSSLDSLIKLTLTSLENVSEACGRRQKMTESEKRHYGCVMTARNALQHAENPTEEKTLGAYYKDSIAVNMGYDSFKDLKSQSLRSVAKHAGEFVTEDRPVGFFTRIFQSLYKAIFGMAAKYAVKSQFSKIGDLASKYYMQSSTGSASDQVEGAESEVFAYHMLHTLMEGRREILSEHAGQTCEASDLHEILMAWLTPEQIDQ